MSKKRFFQARLTENPEFGFDGEAEAIQILDQYHEEGFSDRQIAVMALRMLAGHKPTLPAKDKFLKQFEAQLSQMATLIEHIASLSQGRAVYVEGPNEGEDVDFSHLRKIVDQLPRAVSFEDDEDD